MVDQLIVMKNAERQREKDAAAAAATEEPASGPEVLSLLILSFHESNPFFIFFGRGFMGKSHCPSSLLRWPQVPSMPKVAKGACARGRSDWKLEEGRPCGGERFLLLYDRWSERAVGRGWHLGGWLRRIERHFPRGMAAALCTGKTPLAACC